MAKPPRQRQQEYRKRKQELGFEHLSVMVEARTAASLRALAEQHERSHAEVLTLGILLAARELAGGSSED